MHFNEQNSVEHFIIHQLTGLNLNSVHGNMVEDDSVLYEDETKWRYVQPEFLHRELRKVLWTKYQIKDEDLFNRSYDYIKEYY